MLDNIYRTSVFGSMRMLSGSPFRAMLGHARTPGHLKYDLYKNIYLKPTWLDAHLEVGYFSRNCLRLKNIRNLNSQIRCCSVCDSIFFKSLKFKYLLDVPNLVKRIANFKVYILSFIQIVSSWPGAVPCALKVTYWHCFYVPSVSNCNLLNAVSFENYSKIAI